MRIVITTTDNATNFMRRAGYGFQKEGGGEVAFVRRVGGGLFPRYHAYVTEGAGQITVNLHVDQKAPTYGRTSAHSGEYSGSLVEDEAARLRQPASAPPAAATKPPEEKKGFFGRLFR